MCSMTAPAATLCPDPQDSVESTLERLSAQEDTSTCTAVIPLTFSNRHTDRKRLKYEV